MKYADRTFTVGGWQAPEVCETPWVGANGRCVKCGSADAHPTRRPPSRDEVFSIDIPLTVRWGGLQ